MDDAENAVYRLRCLVSAAEEVSREWDDILNEGYPKCLPSFDEFHLRLVEWLAEVESKR